MTYRTYHSHVIVGQQGQILVIYEGRPMSYANAVKLFVDSLSTVPAPPRFDPENQAGPAPWDRRKQSKGPRLTRPQLLQVLRKLEKEEGLLSSMKEVAHKPIPAVEAHILGVRKQLARDVQEFEELTRKRARISEMLDRIRVHGEELEIRQAARLKYDDSWNEDPLA